LNGAEGAAEDDHSPRGRALKETLAIPQAVRDAVDERDKQHCRVCGKYLGEERALHHVEFGGSARGMGGRRVHKVDEIVTVCWMWAGNCHDLVHGRKAHYQPALREVVKHSGITVMQLLRWAAARNKRNQS
jgi:hypothetical protein